MRIPRSGSSVLRFFGYAIFVFGTLSMIQYVTFQIWYSISPDMGIVLGNGAILLIGLVTLSVASCLRTLERRIDRLEHGQTPT